MFLYLFFAHDSGQCISSLGNAASPVGTYTSVLKTNKSYYKIKSKSCFQIKCVFNHIQAIHSLFRIGVKVFFVEAHGGDYRASGPIDHDGGQQFIQAVFPEKIRQLKLMK